MRVLTLSFLALTSGALLAPSLAFAQDADMAARLHRLENEIETLNRAVYRGEQPPAGSSVVAGHDAQAAALQQRLQQLEVQMRQMNGQLEEQAHNTRMLERKLESAQEELNKKIAEAEAHAAKSPQAPTPATQAQQAAPTSLLGQKPAPADTLAPTAPAAEDEDVLAAGDSNATKDYESAFSLLKRGKYDQAQMLFEQFIAKYPKHALNGNARYWLAESHYVRGQYDKSARLFAEAFQKAPKGKKAADNLLKLGLSLSAQGKNKDACVALKQVVKDFSTGSNAVLKRAQKEMGDLGCS